MSDELFAIDWAGDFVFGETEPGCRATPLDAVLGAFREAGKSRGRETAVEWWRAHREALEGFAVATGASREDAERGVEKYSLEIRELMGRLQNVG